MVRCRAPCPHRVQNGTRGLAAGCLLRSGLCSLIPGLGVKLFNDYPCRTYGSLRGWSEPSA